MTALTEKTINFFITKYQDKGVLTEEHLRELITEVHTQAANDNRKRKPLAEVVKNHLTANKEFEDRVDFYNTVVRNTLNKLPVGIHETVPLIPKNAKLVTFSRVNKDDGKTYTYSVDKFLSGELTLEKDDILWFRYPVIKTREIRRGSPFPYIAEEPVSIPASHLWNDPVEVAQFVRKTVAEEIQKNLAATTSSIEENFNKVKDEFDKVQLDLDKNRENTEKVLLKQKAVIVLREQRKLKRKARKSEKE
jgi:hypothetical protein